MFSKIFIERPILASVVSIVIVVMGLVALSVLPVARYPEITPPTITVSATYPGANAVTVAETVATPIEQEVTGVEDMAYMTSASSSDGTMSLTVTFDVGADLDMSNVLVQNRVSIAQNRLPEEVRRQGVTVKKQSPEITLFMALFSPDGTMNSSALHNYTVLFVQDELKRLPGVGDVRIFGSGQYGMRVWLDPNRMTAMGLTTNDVVNAIRSQNVEVAAGRIGGPPAPPGQAYQFTVNAAGRFTDAEQFENIIVRTGADGQLVYVKDVARVELGAQTYDSDGLFNGKPMAGIAVYQLPGANAIEVADGVVAKMDELATRFPPGLDYQISYDATRVIRASIKEVIVTLFVTLALVIFTVYVFLQNFRATLIPSLTIPVSLIGTFAVMLVLGFSLNILTLFGLILVIGIVVDDAIMVVENCTRILEDNKEISAKDAAIQCMNEVTGPVIATTLVLLAVFVPTIFMPGLVGRLFTQFAVTISVATVFSSINALTLSPAMCGILLKRKREDKREFVLWRWFNSTLATATEGLGGVVTRLIRLAVVGLAVFAGLVVVAIMGFGSLPTGFVPQEDEGYCIIDVQLPPASALDRTRTAVRELSDMITQIDGVENAMGIVGFSLLDSSATSNKGSFIVSFVDWSERGEGRDQAAIVADINRAIAGKREAVAMAFTPPSLPGVGMAGGFAMQLQDRAGVGLDALETASREFIGAGSAQSAIGGMYTGFNSRNPQLAVSIDRERVRTKDLALPEVFSTLSAFLGSAYVNDFSRFGRVYQVRTQADAKYRASPEDIINLQVRNNAGQMTPLGSVLSVEETFGPEVVNHHNGYTAIKLNGSSAPGFSSGQAMGVLGNMAEQQLPVAIGSAWTDLSYQEAKATGSTAAIFLFSVLLVYLVLAAQYESWSLPISVCLAVPTALLGAVAGIYLRGFDNNVYTQVGVVLLIGLSTKTAILMVEFAKVKREEGASLQEAAIEAAKLRFRAVLMTAFSFILGVIPLLVASGAGAESRKVLGTAVFAGMLVATVVSVMTVPMLFFVIQWISEKLRGVKPAEQSGS